jgi:hypothetical protein
MSTLTGSLVHSVHGDQWEDLRAPASTLPIRGNSGDPDDDTDGSLLFDKDTNEQASIIFQMPHGWDRNNVRFHLHWAKTTAASGTVWWQERHRIWNNGSATPAWSSWANVTGISPATGADTATRISSFPEWSMTGMRGSCMLSVQLRRNAAASGAVTGSPTDSYAQDVRLWEADLHYRMDLGSPTEVPNY